MNVDFTSLLYTSTAEEELAELKARKCGNCSCWFVNEQRCDMDITVRGQYPPLGFVCKWWQP